MNFGKKKKKKKKIIEGKLSDQVKLMYSVSLKLSKNWVKEFSAFWKLPDNFEINEV